MYGETPSLNKNCEFYQIDTFSLSMFASVMLKTHELDISLYEPRRQKTGLRGFRPGPTQIRLRRLRKWLEA